MRNKGNNASLCEHIEFCSGYWELNVYLDGEWIHSFDDRSGDILAELECFPTNEESNLLDKLIFEVQQSLECSGKRKLTDKEIEILKIKMIDINNLKDEDELFEKGMKAE